MPNEVAVVKENVTVLLVNNIGEVYVASLANLFFHLLLLYIMPITIHRVFEASKFHWDQDSVVHVKNLQKYLSELVGE